MELGEDLVRRVQGRLGATVGGKWRLERVLGIGGMAAVYAATHRNQNRVAIKMLHPEQSREQRRARSASCAKATSPTASSIRARCACSTTT